MFGALLPLCVGFVHRKTKGHWFGALGLTSATVWSVVSVLTFWLLFPYGSRVTVLCTAIFAFVMMCVLVAMTPRLPQPTTRRMPLPDPALVGLSPNEWPEFAHLYQDVRAEIPPSAEEVRKAQRFYESRVLTELSAQFSDVDVSPERELKSID